MLSRRNILRRFTSSSRCWRRTRIFPVSISAWARPTTTRWTIQTRRRNCAWRWLEIVVAAEPNYMKGYYLLGKCYAAEGKLQDAVKLLERAAELDQNDKSVHYQLGQIYRRLNQPDKSRTEMETFERLYAQERELKAKRIEGSYKDREATKN